MTTLLIISLIFDALLGAIIFWQWRKIKSLRRNCQHNFAVAKDACEFAERTVKIYRQMYYVAWGMWWCAVILLVDSIWSWWKSRRAKA